MGPTRMRLSKPVIAAIEGYAVAGGCELALWCDLRVAATTAIFGIFCRRFGVPLIDLGTIRLPRLIGHSRAMDLILTGREVRAQEAFDIGLANRLAPPARRSRAIELAKQIASFPQTACATTGCPRSSNGDSARTRHSRTRCVTALRPWTPVNRPAARVRSRTARVGTARRATNYYC